MRVRGAGDRPPTTVAVCIEVALGIVLLGAATLAGIVFVHRPWPNRFDAVGFDLLPAAPNSRRWHDLAVAGSARALLVGVAAAVVVLLVRRRFARAAACCIGPAVAIFITEHVAKPLVGRHVSPFGGFSYPSGTVTAAAALAGVLVLASPRLLRPLSVPVALAAVISVSAAVVAMRWHFPTDAVGGACVGLGSLLVTDGVFSLPSLHRSRQRAATHPVARARVRALQDA